MQISSSPRSVLALTIGMLLGSFVHAAEGDLQLYLDTQTKQLYAEPGPNRVSMGAFRPIAEQTAAAAPATNPPHQQSLAACGLAAYSYRLSGTNRAIAARTRSLRAG